MTLSARDVTCRIFNILGGTASGEPSTLTGPLDLSGLLITADEIDSQQSLTITDYIFEDLVSLTDAKGRLSRSGFTVQGVPLPIFRLQRLLFQADLDASGMDALLEAMTSVTCLGEVDFRGATLRSMPSTNFFGLPAGHSALREVTFSNSPRWGDSIVDQLWLWAVTSPPFKGPVAAGACPASAREVEFFANTSTRPTCTNSPSFLGGPGGTVCGIVGPPFRTPKTAVPRFFC